MLQDAIFDNMTYEDWVTATRPKMQGSWNLHESMPKDLDFFIFLSSSAGAIGARGQANYNSGNGFQDALAHHRRSKGMAAVSLDLGPILGAGVSQKIAKYAYITNVNRWLQKMKPHWRCCEPRDSLVFAKRYAARPQSRIIN